MDITDTHLAIPNHAFRRKGPMGVEYTNRGDKTYIIHREAHHTDQQVAQTIDFLARTEKAIHFTIKKPH
jgi:hypothetical protein